MIKLIATDLDGTLFYPKRRIKGVCKSNVKFLSKFASNGGEIFLASGRSTFVIDKLEKIFNSKVTFLGCNGAYIIKDKKLINPHKIDNDKVINLFSMARKHVKAINWLLFSDDKIMYTYPNELLLTYKPILRFVNSLRGFYAEPMSIDKESFFSFLSKGNIYKVMIMMGFSKKVSNLTYQTSLYFRNKFSKDFEIAWSDNVIELTSPNVDKGRSLKKYCLDNNILDDEVITIGDSGNDLSMFKYFKHSFIMSNAHQSLLNKANHIVSRVSDLEKYVDNPSLMKDDKIINI